MVLKIDYEVFRLVRAESEKYWFDPDTYLIVLKNSDESEFIDNPIPFPFTARYETERAFTQTLGKKLQQFFERITDDDQFMMYFWGTVDDGGQVLCDYRKFEDRYHLQKIVDWCEAYNIAYYIDKSDWYLKSLMV